MSIEQRLLQIEQNQKALVNKVKEVVASNNNTVAKLKDLATRVSDGEKLDAKQEAALNSLKNVGKSIEDAEKVVSKVEVTT